MLDREAALEQIDAVFALFESYGQVEPSPLGGYPYRFMSPSENREVSAAGLSCLKRLTGRDSVYYQQATLINESQRHPASDLMGVLRALRRDIEAGCLEGLREAVRADYSGDMLSYAETLLEEATDPAITAAAVLAGGVLEEHIRNLCLKHGISTERPNNKGEVRRKNLAAMNSELVKAGVYNQIEQGSVQTWYRIRTAAAHAEYDKYGASHVQSMIMDLRSFVSRHSA